MTSSDTQNMKKDTANPHYQLEPIAYIRTCFTDKFGIPRQPRLAPSAKGYVYLEPPFDNLDSVAGLEQSSHIWLSFIFHQHIDKGWQTKVRPPRLGGNKKLGVFATRSSFRPNALGLSVVKLDSIETIDGRLVLAVSGVDLMDGTPIVDIKPYIPYADSIPEASNGFAQQPPPKLRVNISKDLTLLCDHYQQQHAVDFKQLITEVLQQDPRPAYQSLDEARIYGMTLLNHNVRWQYQLCTHNIGETIIKVLDIEPID